jgi:predicted ATP-dependent endonuclease of OLD family
MLNELSSGERFILLGLLWQFINKMVQANKIKLYHKNCIFLLDEPDSYLEVYKIDEFMQIIQNDVINGLNFKVILSTHSIMTKNIFDDKNILILDKFDRNNNSTILILFSKFLQMIYFTHLKKQKFH